jgi:NAD-dependent SIR2 family protein deacetylase
MDKFLEKIQMDLENKILTCVGGQSIVKPFNQVFEEVREKQKKNVIKKTFNSENSIYHSVISDFLKEHPEFIKEE